MSSLALVLASVLLGAAGQISLKAGASTLGPLALGERRVAGVLGRILLSPSILLGLALYGLGTFFWLIALSQVSLGYAYPFVSLTYVVILAGSWLLFGEGISRMRILGIAAICLGVYLVSGAA